MLKTRIIPCLLLRGQGLVKTARFADPVYVGDPINAVKIFNDKEVDELIVLDITASREGKRPDFARIADIASECFMPLCYGGGISTIGDIETILSIGVEKVALNTAAIEDPELVAKAAGRFGRQSIVVSIDAKRTMTGRYRVYSASRGREHKEDPAAFAKKAEALGAGEVLLNSVDMDGTQKGYDTELIRGVAGAVGVPVIACGGAGKLSDFSEAVRSGAAAVAAGSLFVFQGKYRAVLISYPKAEDIEALFAGGT